MAKRAINLSVDSELLEECKDFGLNISQFLELRLKEFMRNNAHPTEKTGQNSGPGGVEPPTIRLRA